LRIKNRRKEGGDALCTSCVQFLRKFWRGRFNTGV
jgi:hypothetical protein